MYLSITRKPRRGKSKTRPPGYGSRIRTGEAALREKGEKYLVQPGPAGYPRFGPGSQQRFRGQPKKTLQGEARQEPSQRLLVIAHLSAIIFGNPDEIIVFPERHPVGSMRG